MPDLSDNVNWSEVDANNNQAPPNGWPEGMMPSGVNDAARADRGAMKRFWDKINPVQTVTPSGGVYTFTTGNSVYPTAYVDGEVYSFSPGTAAHSIGGDQFQVNALGPKPILKHSSPALGFIPILAYDIVGGRAAQLVYLTRLNAGAGAFVLLNPQSPLSGDGSGYGGIMNGNLVINRNTAAPPPVFSVASNASVPLQVIGADGENPVCALNSFGTDTFALRLIHANGTGAAPTHTNSSDSLGNLAWSGYGATGWTPSSARIEGIALENFTNSAQGTALAFTTTLVGQNAPVTQAVIGPGLTVGTPPAPSGGMLVGDLNVQRLFCSGAATFNSTVTVPGGISTSGNVTATGLTVNGETQLNGDLHTTGAITGQNLNALSDSYLSNLHVTGSVGITGETSMIGDLHVTGAITGQNLNSIGDSYFQGNIFANGQVSGATLAVTGNAAANSITVGSVPGGIETPGSVNLQDLYFSGQHVLSSVMGSLPAGARLLFLAP